MFETLLAVLVVLAAVAVVVAAGWAVYRLATPPG